MSGILETAVGSMAAPPTLRRYRELGLRLVTCDIYPRGWNAAGMETEFFQARRADEGEAYTAQMLDAVRRYELDFCIPLTDPEVDALAPLREKFAAEGCALCVPERKTAELFRRKDEMNRFLEKRRLSSPIPTQAALPGKPCPFPFPAMVKPRSGRSSLGQAVVADEEGYRLAVGEREDLIAQPFLEGDVFCVDVARDGRGNVRAAVRQELLRNKSGLGMTVEVFSRHPLQTVCASVAEATGLTGVVNMEFIRCGGEYFFLEVNPRFSGGVGFSMEAGMDFAGMLLACYSGGGIEKEPENPRHALLTRESRIVLTEIL